MPGFNSFTPLSPLFDQLGFSQISSVRRDITRRITCGILRAVATQAQMLVDDQDLGQ